MGSCILQWILHDWSDEHCLTLLKNCYKALPATGKAIVVEMVILDDPKPSLESSGVYQVDMIMLAHNPGGKERTQREFESLAKAAGFSGLKSVCSVYNIWVMEFYK